MHSQIFLLVMALATLGACSSNNQTHSSLLTLTSYPVGAQVYEVDREKRSLIPLGKTPYEITASSSHAGKFLFLQIEEKGFVPQFVAIEVSKNHHHAVHAKLKNLASWSDEGQAYTSQLLQIFGEKQNRINALVKMKKHDEALALASQLIAEYPKVSIIYQMRGSVYLLMNQKDLATKDYETALALAPQSIELKTFIQALKSKGP